MNNNNVRLLRWAAVIGVSIGAFQNTGRAAINPTIYFNAGGDPPQSPGALLPLPQLVASGSGQHTGVFTSNDSGNLSNPDGANTLKVIGSNGVYVPGYVDGINGVAGDSSDYLKITGFAPSTDNIYVALKLDDAGKYIDPSNTTVLNQIIQDINDNPFNPNYQGPLASTVSGQFLGVFPGYDVLLAFPSTFSGGTRPAAGTAEQFDVGFDFTYFSDTHFSSLTVTDVGVVPEPASLGSLAAAGLVLLPRYRRRKL